MIWYQAKCFKPFHQVHFLTFFFFFFTAAIWKFVVEHLGTMKQAELLVVKLLMGLNVPEKE